MRQFIKFTLASMTGFLIAIFLFFFFFLFLVSSTISSFKDDQAFEVQDGSVLELKFDRPITERSEKNPFENFDFSTFQTEKEYGLNEILKSIEKAAVDDRIDGILLNLSQVQAGIASTKEIRNALKEFRKSGKFLYAYGESYSQGGYYIASVADSVFLQPQGDIDFRGLAANLMFFKGTLEKLEIEPIIIRHGKFKSAIEPFMLDKMSPENREQTTTFVNSLWDDILNDIAQSRKVSKEELQGVAERLDGRRPEIALETKLIDRIAYHDEVMSSIRKRTAQKENEKIRFVELSKYTKAYVRLSPVGAKKIAVIYAYGDIVSGKGSDDEIGSDRIAEAIRKAGRDSTIKAIVFRVNSPGGSALASDVILREVKRAKKAKPFIVSMGDLAASGGYYISCAADTIVAQPSTITGSIGVFGLLFNAQKMLNNKLGLTFDTVKTTRMSDIGSPTRPMTAQERAIMQEEVEKVYDTFITHVSEGRGISKAEVDSIGQGRVWSGADAKRLKLVDVLGGLDDAIAIAAKKAGLKEYRTVDMPEQKEFFEKLMEDFNTETSVAIGKEQFGQMYDYYKSIGNMLKQKGVLARIPYAIEFN